VAQHRSAGEILDETEALMKLQRRLDILISLELEKMGPGGRGTLAYKIDRLREFGLKPSEIAVIVGRPLNSITSSMAKAKRARGE